MSQVGQTRQREGTESAGSNKKAKVSDEKAEIKVGIVNTFQGRRGFGFISQDGGPDVFVHQSQILAAGDGFRVLNVGQKVEFTAVEENGRWKATKVTGLGGVPIPTKVKGGKKGQSKTVSPAELQAKVQTQIEYYLSDKNLSRDLWMRAFLLKDSAVSVANLLKCNKLKALTKDLKIIEAAVTDSKCLHMTTLSEADSSVPAIARGPDADNVNALPQYTPPSVLLLTDLNTGDGAPTWKDIRAGFLAAYSAPLFVYLANEPPFIVVNTDNKEVASRAIEGGVTDIEGKQLCSVAAASDEKQGEALLEKHYAALAKTSKGKKSKQERKRGGGRQVQVEGPVTVGTEEFPCQQDVYDKVKGIMKQYKNSSPLLGEDKKFMMTLLKAHPRASEKMKFARSIIVKDNANYEGQSRCFYVINKDSQEEDISYVKCIRNLPAVPSS